MNKNTNKDFVFNADELVDIFGDVKVELPFHDLKEGMDTFFNMMGLTADLIRLIRQESELKKRHRAYLHVRDELEKCADEADQVISATLDTLSKKEHIYHVSSFPFAPAEDDDDSITIPKEKYEHMIEDLLTMAELIDMVSDMRTNDVRTIQEFGKFIPAYASYEQSRLSLYREAAKEAEDIINRWEDELDEDYEPDEYFSD